MTPPACIAWPIPDELPVANLDQHDMLRWQDGRCAMCGYRDRIERLVVDHDHVTGLVRGGLCRSCNSQEGHAGPTAERWVAWRTGSNPAGLLNISDEYHYLSAGQAWMEEQARLPVDDAALDRIADAVTR